MTMLFCALKRAGCGENDQGVVFIDGRRAYRHWVEDDKVFFETVVEDAAFVDQDAHFSDRGRLIQRERGRHFKVIEDDQGLCRETVAIIAERPR